MTKRWLVFLMVGLLAFSLYGCGSTSSDSTTEETPAGEAADTTAPSAPSGLAATGGCNKVDLAWVGSTDDKAVTGYKVYRNGANVATVGTTTYSDINLASATQYCYKVSAMDAAGNESSLSAESCGTTSSGTTTCTWGAAVGVAYKVEGSGSTPLGGATISVDGVAVGTTASDGSFNLGVENPKAASEVKLTATGYNTVSKTANVSASEVVYLYTMPLDLKKTLLSATLGKSLLPPPPAILSDSQGIAEVYVEQMNLNRSLAVTVSPFSSSKAIQALTDLKNKQNDLTKGFTIIGGADLTVQDSSTQAELGDNDYSVGNNAKVKPRTKGIIGQYTATDLYYFSGQASTGSEKSKLEGLYKIYLYYYSKTSGAWTQAGVGSIVKNTSPAKAGEPAVDTYTLMPATGVKIPKLQSYAYVLESPETLEAKVTGTITDCVGSAAINDAQITAGDDEDETGSDGTYEVEPTISFNSPMVQVCATKAGYYDKCASVDITMNTGGQATPATKNLCLDKIPVLPIVKGKVSDSDTTAGIGGADVTLTTSSVLTGDQIIINGTTAEVGLDPNAAYTWAISIDGGATFNTLATGTGKNTFDIVTDVNTTTLSGIVADIAGGTADLGVIILKVTVDHANGLTESATGSVYVNVVLPAINSVTSTGGVDVWGGQDKGFYFINSPTAPASVTWTLNVEWDGSYYDPTLPGPYTSGSDLNPSKIVADTVVSTGDTLTISQIMGFATNNALTLITPIITDYSSQCGLTGSFFGVMSATTGNTPLCLTPYILDGVALNITATAYDSGGAVIGTKKVQANLYDFGVEVSDVVIQANTNAAPYFETEANADGNYEFTNLPVGLVGVTSSAKAEGYYGSDPWAVAATIGSGTGMASGTGTGGALALNDVVTIDLSLVPVPPAATTSYTEDFTDCTDWTMTGYNTSYSGSKTTSSTVAWQCILGTENYDATTKAGTAGYSPWVVPAGLQGAMSYPEEGMFFIDTSLGGEADGAAYPVALLAAHGTDDNYAWFGYGPNAYQCFTDVQSNTSGSAFSGTLTSPVIDLADFSYATLDYWSWFEAESVDIALGQYDQMIVEVKVTDGNVKVNDYTTLAANQWVAIDTMNPKSEPSAMYQSSTQNFSSGGVNAVPIWLHKLANLNPLVGHTIQIRFLFDTKDTLFNAFRGWGVDDFQITNTDSGLPFKKLWVPGSYLTKPSR